jgi:two-component system response regulator YesN
MEVAMYRLLIVDDDFEIRNGLCKFFPWDSIGFQVVGDAENGKEAYTFIRNNPVDVVLCDIRMPIMSGVDLASELSVHYPKINIIFFSAYKDFDYAQKAIEVGVKRYILKSTNFNELVRVFTTIKTELDNLNQAATPLQARSQPEDLSNFADKMIHTIKEHVEQNYQHVTLEDLARIVNLNPDYLSKFFKKHAGILFSEYLTQVRMQRAAQFLDDIQYKTYEISEMVGYSNAFNFTRAFKNYYGMNPRDYRNKKELK